MERDRRKFKTRMPRIHRKEEEKEKKKKADLPLTRADIRQEPVYGPTYFEQLWSGWGNGKVAAFFKAFERIQAKMQVSTPGDACEKQADRVAEEVVKGKSPDDELHLPPLLKKRLQQYHNLPESGPPVKGFDGLRFAG